ncbi:hypothetical protein ScPMuIL_011593 [Solemya velum]
MGRAIRWENICGKFYLGDQRMRAMRQLVCMNEKVSKKKQKTYYDRKARHRVHERGQKVFFLLPTSKSKLLAQWKGPYEVVERVNPVDYRIRLSNTEHVYHINMLKRWFDRQDPDEKSVDIAKEYVISCLHVMSALASGESAVDEEPNEFPSLSIIDVTICSDLTREQVGELESLLSEFSDVLSDVPKQTSLITHSVKTTTDIPIHRKPYPIPYALQDKVKKELQQMKELGIIEDSDSPYSAPMVLVKRPEASLRICIDFRELNRVTVFDPRPMPRMDDVLNRLGKAKYLRKIDLTKGYWQVPLDEDAKQKSSFVTPFGQYRFTVMPFGMVCAPATFVRLMAKVLQGYESFTEAFIDDIGVYSDTWNDHIEHLRLVFLALRESNLSAKPSKCSFGFPELVFLAHVVGNMMVKPALDKLAIVQNFPQPLIKKQIRLSCKEAIRCPAGSYSRTGLVPCRPCAVGSYQGSVGSTSCTPCETGSYQASVGSTSCNKCGKGLWTSTTGSTANTDCRVLHIATDCGDFNGTTSGVYKIKPHGVEEPFSVYCDIQAEGEGWTVFQRRHDGSVDFFRDWESYEIGFGDLMGEFWLGNHFIYSITNQGSYELNVTMSDFEGNSAYAHYDVFKVGNASSNYLLTVSGYSGNAGDSLSYHSDMKFSTYDRDNDEWSDHNCAEKYKGAWWYNSCHLSNLNGEYRHRGTHTTWGGGLVWRHWKVFDSLKSTTMSVRRRP